mmetsp:Transcript_38784/g.125400  ORF Transcript_38784/g.125400 Transcript_38784/m.125400 type:complete len:384 (-) Transcript_38784:599-1750(-)
MTRSCSRSPPRAGLESCSRSSTRCRKTASRQSSRTTASPSQLARRGARARARQQFCSGCNREACGTARLPPPPCWRATARSATPPLSTSLRLFAPQPAARRRPSPSPAVATTATALSGTRGRRSRSARHTSSTRPSTRCGDSTGRPTPRSCCRRCGACTGLRRTTRPSASPSPPPARRVTRGSFSSCCARSAPRQEGGEACLSRTGCTRSSLRGWASSVSLAAHCGCCRSSSTPICHSRALSSTAHSKWSAGRRSAVPSPSALSPLAASAARGAPPPTASPLSGRPRRRGWTRAPFGPARRSLRRSPFGFVSSPRAIRRLAPRRRRSPPPSSCRTGRAQGAATPRRRRGSSTSRSTSRRTGWCTLRCRPARHTPRTLSRRLAA